MISCEEVRTGRDLSMSQEKDINDGLKSEEGYERKKADENMKMFSEVLKQLSLLTQFGLTLLIPTVMCLGICYLLTVKTGAGSWIYIPGLILGLGSSGMVAWKFYLQVMKDEKKHTDSKKEKTISYNRHE